LPVIGAAAADEPALASLIATFIAIVSNQRQQEI